MFKNWDTPENVFHILKRLSRGRPRDIGGIRDYQMLDDAGGIQWPLADRASLTNPQRRLFEDGQFHTPDKRARFVFEAPCPASESVDEAFPFLLLTGRATSAQWHTQTRTAKSALLRSLYPKEIYVEIHPADAQTLGIEHGDLVRVQTRRGSLQAKAIRVSTLQPGQVFIPMHYPEANRLTHPSFDSISRQPNYKACAARLVPSRATT